MPPIEQITDGFLSYARDRLADNLAQIERCVGLLTVEQIWHRPNEVSNAIGNLVLHLSGNVRQWIMAGLDGQPDARDRPSEFARRDTIPTAEILNRLRETVQQAVHVISQLTAEELTQPIKIQGYEVTGLQGVFHVTEHFSLHTGQIVYATKVILNCDLNLYDADGNRLDGHNVGVP